MMSQYFQNIQQVEIYATLAFLIFFVFFILVTAHTVKIDKRHTDRYSQLPLEDGINNIQEQLK